MSECPTPCACIEHKLSFEPRGEGNSTCVSVINLLPEYVLYDNYVVAIISFLSRYIHSHNRQNLSYKLKINHMTDYSDGEIKKMRGYRHTKNSPRGETFVSKTRFEDVPNYFNWRLRGNS